MLISRENRSKSGNKITIALHKANSNQYFALAFSLFSLVSMSTSTIEMDNVHAVEEQSSVQQSAQLRDPNSSKQNVFQRFSQAINFSGSSQNSTEEFSISDLGKYLNDASKSSEVSFIHSRNIGF